ncbi:arf-GAP domain and FG repeat-containing protein 1-like isoform X2 [Tachypleus tridentatus]|uniref:arf-GAP domain and FG repeat-containing protein 1-like isoform X2 n=1 Tax=Tachypleus tridentatus TaxID=6853 RepID=UPI003FD0C7DD
MASRRKVQELDKNVKVLRELAKLPANRQCFDCHQRGPTYVNVTIGSFVCTSCSGLLRGLNPPHRVKSITMTNFTSEEIDFIKQKGNEYCRYVWLGTCDSKACMEPEMRDEHCNRDFMIQKYERKRWYVDPETAVRKMQNEEQQFSETQPCKPEQKGGHVTLVSQNSIPETKPLSTLLGDTAAPLVIQNCKQNTYSWSSSDTLPSEPPRALKSQDINTDIFRDFGKDPFAQNTTANSNETVTTNGSFANFDSIFTDAQSTGQFKTQGFAAFPNSTSAGSFLVSSLTIHPIRQ